MRVAIVGSRGYGNLTKVANYVATLAEDTVVVSGGAVGVDSAAERAALDRGLEVVVYLPDWERYGKSAGIKRNAEIVEGADMLVAFWDGVSHGTANSVDLAKRRGIQVTVILENTDE